MTDKIRRVSGKWLLVSIAIVIIVTSVMAAEYNSYPPAKRYRKTTNVLGYDNVSSQYRSISGQQVEDLISQDMVCQPGGIYDGATGPQGVAGASGDVCYITGGLAGITYDANGINPVPAMSAYAVTYLKNGILSRIPTSFSWSVGSVKTVLSGSGSSATFAPTVFGTYSAAKANNYISVLANYSGRQCRASYPVAVSKVGAKGDQGQAAVVDAVSVRSALATPTDSVTWVQPQSNSITAGGFGVKDYAGNVAALFRNGYTDMFDATGNLIFRIDRANRSVGYYASGGILRVYWDPTSGMVLQ